MSDNWIAETQLYKPWGEQRHTTGLPGDINYTGQRKDTTTGLHHYKSRYYDNYSARFTQPDTIIPNPTRSIDYNRYAYVKGNPVKYTDPTGHCAWGLPCPGKDLVTSAAGFVSNVCYAGSSGCTSFKDQHPVATQHVVNASGGFLQGVSAGLADDAIGDYRYVDWDSRVAIAGEVTGVVSKAPLLFLPGGAVTELIAGSGNAVVECGQHGTGYECGEAVVLVAVPFAVDQGIAAFGRSLVAGSTGRIAAAITRLFDGISKPVAVFAETVAGTHAPAVSPSVQQRYGESESSASASSANGPF